jgi:hypothetical protein
MSRNTRIRQIADSAAYYKICLYGRVTPDWSENLGGMQAALIDRQGETPVTVLTGILPDQAALAGVLGCIYNYGFALKSLERRETNARQGCSSAEVCLNQGPVG